MRLGVNQIKHYILISIKKTQLIYKWILAEKPVRFAGSGCI